MRPANNIYRAKGMDARLKILVLAALLCLVLSSKGALLPSCVLVGSFLTCLWIKVSWKMALIRLLEPLVIILVLVTLKSISGAGESLWDFTVMGHAVHIYRDGLHEGLMLALRIMATIGAVTAVSLSTPFAEFLGALSWLKVPGPFVEVALFAWRYLQNLFDDAHVIYNSQKTRLGYSSARRAFSSFGTLAGSLLIKAFDQAEATAASLHQRGYDGSMPIYNKKAFKAGEALQAVALVALMAVIWTV